MQGKLAFILGLSLGCASKTAERPNAASSRPAPLGAAPLGASAPGAAERDAAVDVDGTPEPSVAAPAPWPRSNPSAVESDWCIAGLDALEDGACYLMPARPTDALLIYFHGVVPPTKDNPHKTKVQTVVLNAARRAGVVALLPRGEQGLAPAGRGDWLGWPTTDATYERYARRLLERIARQRKKLEEAIGAPFARVYVAGSSSGAYFTTMLALRGGLAADGFAAISGGSPPEAAWLGQELLPRPFYIGCGKNEGSVRTAARALAVRLGRARWPIRVAEHPLDHGAHEIYLDEAFSFWRERAPAMGSRSSGANGQ